MLIANIADLHIDEHSRFDECVRVLDWIADDCARRGVAALLCAGDVYERKSTPRERKAAADFFQRVAEHCPVVIVRGNHDAIGDLPLLERLETEHPIRVVEGAEVVDLGFAVVGCLAWPSKASILALGAESHAEGELVAGEALRNVLRGLGQKMAMGPRDSEMGGHVAPRILLAHAMVRGSTTSVGQPLVGCDLEVGVEDLALADADFVSLGHIHKGQDWEALTRNAITRSPVVYPGSPRRTTFGETEAKGYVLAEFSGSLCHEWRLIETPCAPMVLIENEWLGTCWRETRADWGVNGAEVRIRYQVDADQRAAAREAAEQWKGALMLEGAVNVKLDEQVRPVNSARAPEVAKAHTVGEKLLALWRARGSQPEAPRAEKLLGKVSQLEEVAS